jgi:hypothetical protein
MCSLSSALCSLCTLVIFSSRIGSAPVLRCARLARCRPSPGDSGDWWWLRLRMRQGSIAVEILASTAGTQHFTDFTIFYILQNQNFTKHNSTQRYILLCLLVLRHNSDDDKFSLSHCPQGSSSRSCCSQHSAHPVRRITFKSCLLIVLHDYTTTQPQTLGSTQSLD